jgi:hypothetical protein
MNELFSTWHPLLDRVAGNKKLARLKSRFKEFKVTTAGPGALHKIVYGNETYAANRRQNFLKGNQYATRFIYDFAIPAIDIAETAGSPDMVKDLVKQYPESALMELKEWVAAQIARGAASSGSLANAGGLDGLVTLNGQQDYTPATDARDGVFMPAAAASQTQTVFGIPMQGAVSLPTTGWYHQYQNISAFGVNGREKWRKCRDDANSQGGGKSLGGEIDLLLTDPQTYQNYVNDLDEHVEVAVVKNDHTPAGIRTGTKFGNADVFSEIAIDLSDTTSFTTATTRAGMTYLLNSKEWDGFCLGEDDKMETKGFFSFRGPTRIPDQDAWRWEIINHWNIFCRQLRNQGLVTGGATA